MVRLCGDCAGKSKDGGFRELNEQVREADRLKIAQRFIAEDGRFRVYSVREADG